MEDKDLNIEEDTNSDMHFKMLVDSLPEENGKTDDDLIELARIVVRECNSSDTEEALMIFGAERPDAFKTFAKEYLRKVRYPALQKFLDTMENPEVNLERKQLMIRTSDAWKTEELTKTILANYIRTAHPEVTELAYYTFNAQVLEALGIHDTQGPVH